MATIALGPMRPVGNEQLSEPKDSVKEGASETFKKGAVVGLTAGLLVELSTDPTNILGVSLADGKNVATNPRNEVALAKPGALFIANLSGSSITAQSDLGVKYGLVKTGTNWHVDKTETDNVRVVIRSVDPDAIGDTNGRVIFEFLATHTVFGGAADVNVSNLDLAQGSIIVGDSSADGSAVDASTDKQILVGDGTTLASVAMSGDTTISNTGVVAIGAAKVLATMVAEGMPRMTRVQLTDTNVKALATGAGIELLATPGADKAHIVLGVFLVADAAAGAWVEPSAPDDLVVQYAGGADITGAIEAGVLVAADVSMAQYMAVATEITPEPNVGVNLFNTGSNWTGGNAANSMSVLIIHSVIPTIAFS